MSSAPLSSAPPASSKELPGCCCSVPPGAQHGPLLINQWRGSCQRSAPTSRAVRTRSSMELFCTSFHSTCGAGEGQRLRRVHASVTWQRASERGSRSHSRRRRRLRLYKWVPPSPATVSALPPPQSRPRVDPSAAPLPPFLLRCRHGPHHLLALLAPLRQEADAHPHGWFGCCW